jgi:predicted small metal-binding protein
MTVDCRTMPSDSNCTLTIAGEPEEVLRAAVAHAVDVHGHTDDEELRDGIRGAMTPAAEPLEVAEGGFVQVIEFDADDIGRFAELEAEWLEGIGDARTAGWSVMTVDRDRPGRYVQFVGFPDYEAAMRNSKHPATQRIAEQLTALAKGEPTFRNLDVTRVMAP